jgi:Centromere DNA-binding protein complex CBF3 subunit, domain 2
MRHSNVLLCPIGALAMYLYFRFKMSGEFNSMFDFSSNVNWFLVKLYTDGSREKMYKGISTKGYSTAMGVVAHALGVSSKHTTHLGRVLGPKVLEMLEFSPEEIRVLGNWDPKVQESTYSTKLPMRVIRGMAGFERGGGMHYNPRTAVPVPEELSKEVFPWLQDCRDHLDAHEAATSTLKPTARQFLKHMALMADVLVQDVAVLKLKHPERCVEDFPLFKDSPIFNGDRFKVSLPCRCCLSGHGC